MQTSDTNANASAIDERSRRRDVDTVVREVKEEARSLGQRLTHALERPGVAGIVSAGAVLAAAAAFGVSEAIVAALAGYSIYRMLLNRHAPTTQH